MRSACTPLALAGLGQAKVFLFNAENCNTNLDNFKNYDFVSEQLLFRFFFSPLFPFFVRSRTARWLCNQTPNPRAVPPASKQIFHSKSECMCVSAVCVPVGERRAPFFFSLHIYKLFFFRIHCPAFCLQPSRSVNSAVDLENMWTGDKAPKNVAFTTENDAEKPIAVRVTSGESFFISISGHLAQTPYSTLYALRFRPRSTDIVNHGISSTHVLRRVRDAEIDPPEQHENHV